MKVNDNRYNFICTLCDAIEKYTNDKELSDKRIFFYNNLNLKYAIERFLYITLVNNQELLKIYDLNQTDSLESNIVVSSQLVKEFASNLLGDQVIIRVSLFKDLFQRVKVAAFSLANSLLLVMVKHSANFTKMIIKEKPTGNKINILCSVISGKFIRYLIPLIAEVPQIHFVSSSRINIKDIMEDGELNYTCHAPRGIFSKHPVNRFLTTHFYSTIRICDYLEALLDNYMPDKVLVLEGNAVHDEVLNQLCKQRSISIICMQQGWSPVVHNGFRNMSFSKMLVWGKGFSEILQEYNPLQVFVVSGSHVINNYKTNSNNDKQSILFSLQSPSTLIKFGHWDEFLYLIEETAQNHEDYLILVREHPNYKLSEEEYKRLSKHTNIRFMPPEEYTLSDVYKDVCLSVSIFSTLILESIAFGVVPLIVNIVGLPSYNPDIHKQGAGIEVQSIDDAKQMINKCLTDQDYLNSFNPSISEFQKKYFNQRDSNDQSAVKYIAQIIQHPDS